MGMGGLEEVKTGMLGCLMQAVLGAKHGSEAERDMVERHIVGMT